MRVLLVVIHPVPGVFPQGIAYVAAVLEAAGHQVFGVNINNTPSPASIPKLLYDRLLLAKEQWQPEALAIGGLSGDYPFVKRVVDIWRQLSPDTPIIIGGGLVTADADFVFEAMRPDFAISDEAEIPIVKLLNALETDGDVSGVQGLRYWRDGQAIATAAAPRTKAMLKLPFPNYEPFDMEGFFATVTTRQTRALAGSATKPRPFPVSASRSCPYKCTFCYHSPNLLYRARPIDDVIDEIVFFYEKYRFTILHCYDELFSAIDSRIPEFCEKIKKTGIAIDWACTARVTDVNSDLLRQMRDAGCVLIGYGLESASDPVLSSMRKKITKADIARALTLTEQEGIAFQGNFIFGDPAETPETVDETMSFFKGHCQDHAVELGLIRPYPGAPIFQRLTEAKVITNKAEYYERIGRTNFDFKANYNMTSMSDPMFWDVMNSKVAGQNRRRNTVADSLFLCKKVDKEGWETRSEVIIGAKCPHCSANFEKSYDIYFDPTSVSGWKAIEVDIFHLCANCKKTSNILVSPLLVSYREAE